VIHKATMYYLYERWYIVTGFKNGCLGYMVYYLGFVVYCLGFRV
jgi:hypothetical protein